jgi:hypothetical protein
MQCHACVCQQSLLADAQCACQWRSTSGLSDSLSKILKIKLVLCSNRHCSVKTRRSGVQFHKFLTSALNGMVNFTHWPLGSGKRAHDSHWAGQRHSQKTQISALFLGHPACRHPVVKFFPGLLVQGPYFIWHLSFVTSRRQSAACVGGREVGYGNTISNPTGSDNRQLSHKIMTL